MALSEAARAAGAHGTVVEVAADLPPPPGALSMAELTDLVLRLEQLRVR